jgi:hypothetical protein
LALDLGSPANANTRAFRRTTPWCEWVSRARLLALAVLLCGAVPIIVVAQAPGGGPWQGWYGPPADGIYGIRFGMDRLAVDEVVRGLGLQERPGRPTSLRYEGRLEGRSVELVCDFLDAAADRARSPLYRIQLLWRDISGGTRGPLTLFSRLDARLAGRYGDPRLRRNSTEGKLSTAEGIYLRIYEDVEVHAQLELRAQAPERYYVRLELDYPQLHPEFTQGQRP